MITYKPIIIQGGRRKDGTWPVKIRVTFKGVSRRLPTTLACTDADVTRSGKIKNATILQKAGELITRMRGACESLSPFTLENWTVDDVVAHIRDTLTAETFRLDFLAFGREYIMSKAEGTRAGYTTALKAFARFLGRESLDVNEISRTMLVEFQEWADQQGRIFYNYKKGVYQSTGKPTAKGGNAGRWVTRLAHIFQAAKDRYNDEDSGRILIPRSPFDSVPKKKVHHHGQDCLPVEVVQRIIDARPEAPQERVALALFVISFGTMGANLVDLFYATPPKGQKWRYFRRKTTDKREDRAEVIVALEPCLEAFIRTLREGPKKSEDAGNVWLPALRIWKSSLVANTMVNKYLRRWCEREGVEVFTFYAARHTWATLARRIGVEKATVDEALAHVGDYRVTDIYAERNWELAWEANRRVLALFSWPGEVHDDGNLAVLPVSP